MGHVDAQKNLSAQKGENTENYGLLRFNNTATLMPVIPEYMTAVVIHAALLHQ